LYQAIGFPTLLLAERKLSEKELAEWLRESSVSRERNKRRKKKR